VIDLTPAIKAMCEAGKGEKLEIIMDDAAAFNDMKEYFYGVLLGKPLQIELDELL